jgi:hypothetical protein
MAVLGLIDQLVDRCPCKAEAPGSKGPQSVLGPAYPENPGQSITWKEVGKADFQRKAKYNNYIKPLPISSVMLISG